MKKTLFTAALAFVLSIGGVVLSAQDSITLEKDNSLVKLVVQSKIDVNLMDSLTKTSSATSNNMSFGYKKVGGDFVPLLAAMTEKEVTSGDTKSATLVLGKFQAGDKFQFGYGNDGEFDAVAPTFTVSSDAGFYAGYDVDSFYHLDFSKDPFDGRIDILIMGEPLPASTVTLLVALAAAAAILLYHNRRTRVLRSEQA